ncbi:MAG: hypothetical protein OEU36_18010 [Gammaproteobacteria bacterium]|nr:hypothetical protein [Gammaproteobacteria bacterium]
MVQNFGKGKALGTTGDAECAVLGVANALKGQLPLGLLVLNDAQYCGR